MGVKPWDGRFSEKTDKLVEKFTSSIDLDRRLYAHDILGSMAHARTLARAGVLSEEDLEAIIRGLAKVQEEIESGNFVFDDSLEDIHMHVESRLAQMVGKPAQRLHTARSRNDQVATDTRLWLRDANREVIGGLWGLRSVLVDLAGEHAKTILPGYTHMQRAQAVTLGHHLLAYYEMFTRDAGRFSDCHRRINIMPLGAAALAGTPYDLDREYTAALRGFDGIAENSMDAVSDRDFILEFLSAASIAMVHLSRLSEEIILWYSQEFGFLSLSDAFATGSSIMPQKKNPDVAELTRGRTGKVFGNLMAGLTMMKGLPLAYNRDMQEDKEPLFETADTLLACLPIMAAMLSRTTFFPERMEKACEAGFLSATDLADYLVEKGIPFRQAHEMVGRAVAHALSEGKELSGLSLSELRRFSEVVEGDVYERLSLAEMVARRRSLGGTSQENVKKQAEKARRQLDSEVSTESS